MRAVGFSTGALALGDFRHALQMLEGKHTGAVELSALRENELKALVSALPSLDLGGFNHVSFHAPSTMGNAFEPVAAKLLDTVVKRGWLVIVHPDVIRDRLLWKGFGQYLCLENMDKRKPVGQTADQLAALFDSFPDASFCFDLGHARQVDPTMTEAFLIVRRFGSRLRQLHISDVNSESRHAELTIEAMLAFKRLAPAIPPTAPVIIESRVSESQIESEIQLVREILDDDNRGGRRTPSLTQAISA
jgi:hypothetical protein